LDLGCGSGASAIVSAEEVGNTGKVIGIDLAEKMLELAIKRQKKRVLPISNFLMET
jgi:ubiquinone/menaquinone biosynthesis C-methylase UbiE